MANEQDTLDDENSHRIHLDHLDGGHSSFGAAATQHHQGERPRVHGDNDLAVESASSPSAWSSCSRCGNRWSSPWHPTHAVVVDRATGSKFLWNARSHRKLRFPVSLDPDPHLRHHPRIAHQRWHVVSWEPHIVTWYICWVGVIANTLWVVNGLYATWPALARTVDPLLISYGTGVLGAFLFIVTGYLGFVEAINQTYSHVDLPRLSRHRNKILRNGTPTQFHAPVALLVYGQWPSPIGHEDLSTAQNRSTRTRLLQQGYPLVVDVQSQRLLTGPHLDNVSKTPDEKLIGRKVVIHVAGHVLSATIDECYGDHTPLGDLVDGCDASNVNDVLTGYRWWTWSPDLSYLGIFNAVAFFVSTIIFFIPACAWWPMAESGASLGQTIWWVYVLQIIPCVGFIYFGLATMAEASGSWVRPAFDCIGWWISSLNFLGGVGFMLYAVLALPSVIHPNCCGVLTQYGANLATFWGSCFFWISGVLQCIEFSSKHPILL